MHNSDSAEYYIKQTVKWCNNPVKTRTEDENTTRAADSVCRRRKNEFAPMKVPRTTRNTTSSFRTEYFDYITTINVGKSENASGNSRKDYNIIIIIMT